MTNEIIFYHNPVSRGRTVHWLLEEIGVPYRTEIVRFDKAEHKGAAYLAINPMGKVPAISHRGVIITEVAAICTYLADAFPAAKLAPSIDDLKRGTFLRWMFFGAGCFEPALVDHLLARPPAERPGTVGYGTYADTLKTLEIAISSGPFVLGDQFSAVDVYLASQIGWGLMAKGLEPRPAFVEYVKRASDRPAYRRAAEQNEQMQVKIKSESST